MLIYKQRYKSRTTREFTKSDLTVYDSAGNTALNALTVYGKSEVVDGVIKSAGEDWATVRLADLTWEYIQGADYNVFRAPILNIKEPQSYSDRLKGLLCSKYAISTNPSYSGMNEKSILKNLSYIFIKDNRFNSTTDFVASLGDATLCYELADPTQGNAITVKTDDGTGINGTMAVFSTGTPLRGIPDTDVRDVMVWDGSAGTVTKNCGEIDLGTLTWNYAASAAGTKLFISSIPSNIKRPPTGTTVPAIVCAEYTVKSWDELNTGASALNGITVFSTDGSVRIVDSAYNDAETFKTAMNGVKLIYELATPTTTPLTSTENASIAALRTFTPQTHAQNNAQTEMTVDYTIRVPTI